MPRTGNKQLSRTPTWTCPHCAHVHTAVTLRRLGSGTLECDACKRPFASIPDRDEEVKLRRVSSGTTNMER